jgi:hypothetical protein
MLPRCGEQIAILRGMAFERLNLSEISASFLATDVQSAELMLKIALTERSINKEKAAKRSIKKAQTLLQSADRYIHKVNLRPPERDTLEHKIRALQQQIANLAPTLR